MPRSRNNNQSPVSLFPFLAVLISTMGALIFLLIVITNKVRHDVVASHDKAYPLPTVSIEPAKPENYNYQLSIPAPIAADPVREVIPQPVRTFPQFVETTPEITRSQADEELEKLKREYQQWQAYINQLDERLSAARQKIDELDLDVKNKRKLLESQHQDQEQKLTSTILLGEQTAKQEKHLAQLKLQVDQLQKTRVELEAKQKKVEYQAATRTSEFVIIPYDGEAGTTRRPIYLECTAEGITFQPEGVTLKISDLEHFTPRMNPLLSGVMVLRDYWLNEDKKKDPTDARLPYIMVIVRPSGTLGFYGSQTLLQRIASPMGYELIEEDRQLAYPPKSKEAQDLLLEAIRISFDTKTKEFAATTEGVPYGFGDAAPVGKSDPRWSSKPGPAPGYQGEKGKFLAQPGTGESERNKTGNDSQPNSQEGNSSWVPKIVDMKPGLEGNSNTDKSGIPEKAQESNNSMLLKDMQESGRTAENSQQQNSTATERTSKGQTSASSPAANPSRQSFGESSEMVNSPMQKLEIKGESEQPAPIILNNSKKKSWGSSNSRLIGLEQSIVVKVMQNRIQIGKHWVEVGRGETAKQIQDAVSDMANQEVNSWGNPPEGFHWVPSLKCQISPGGNVHYERFAQQLRREGYSVIAEQVFDK